MGRRLSGFRRCKRSHGGHDRERAKEGRRAREMIVPEKKMMLPPPSSSHFKRAGRAAKWVGVPGIGGRQSRVLEGSSE